MVIEGIAVENLSDYVTKTLEIRDRWWEIDQEHRRRRRKDKGKRRSPCSICGEPDAMVGYFWTGGRVAYLHAACDTVCMQERERQEGT